jgi:hypothetical protein
MIINLKELKTYLNIVDNSQDSFLELLIDCANDFVVNYTGRSFNSADYIEYINGDGQKDILLSNYPIITLTSFKRNTGTQNSPTWEDIDVETYTTVSKT